MDSMEKSGVRHRRSDDLPRSEGAGPESRGHPAGQGCHRFERSQRSESREGEGAGAGGGRESRLVDPDLARVGEDGDALRRRADPQRDLLPGRHARPYPPALPAALRREGQADRRDRDRIQARQRQRQRPDLQQSDLHRRVHLQEHQHHQRLHQADALQINRPRSALGDADGRPNSTSRSTCRRPPTSLSSTPT